MSGVNLVAIRKGQVKTAHDARVTSKQHRKPCVDCPWARASAPGWLGELTADEWIRVAHGDGRIECHTRLETKTPLEPWQCAGAAIYRANICKVPRDKTNLDLPPDRETVFRGPVEFLNHHNSKVTP